MAALPGLNVERVVVRRMYQQSFGGSSVVVQEIQRGISFKGL